MKDKKLFYTQDDLDGIANMNFMYGFVAGIGALVILGLFLYARAYYW